MSSDNEKRLEALYQQVSSEKDPEKLKQLISEILAVLEAHQQHHEAARPGHPTTKFRRGSFRA
jgi:predicted outer membrane protein